MDEPIRRPTTFPYCGRLIALPSTQARALANDALLDAVSIDFPSMPDSIDLVRRTDYLVQSAPNLPDGIHLYKGTAPLEIPFSFKLHAFDEEYCPHGALTLLQLAARLHSFVLPISTDDNAQINTKAGNSVDPSNDTSSQVDRSALPNNPVTVDVIGADIFAPVTVVLELMRTETQMPGISCVGYVKDVAVKLNGPFMRGPLDSFNLPSSADFSFTFVHRPGHGNTFRVSQEVSSRGVGNTQPQAFANWVKSNLYNTRALAKLGDYRGFTAAEVQPAITREAAPEETQQFTNARQQEEEEAAIRGFMRKNNLLPPADQSLVDAILGN